MHHTSTHTDIRLIRFNELLQPRFRINRHAVWIQIAVAVVVAHFLGKVTVVNARNLRFGKADDLGVGFGRPVDHEIVKVAAGGAENNDLVVQCHDGMGCVVLSC